MSSLTQLEAAERAGLIAVERYDIAVDLTHLPRGRCESTITFTCRRPGAESFVDCAAEVESATLNGAALPAAVDGRIPLAGLAERNQLTVVSVHPDAVGGNGIHRAVDPADGSVYVWTDFTCDYARYLWACFDQPDLKAPHALTVTAPAEWLVLSNSGDPVVADLGGLGKAPSTARRWAFPATPPLSTYNVVINAGPYHQLRREAAGHDLGVFARQSLAPILERDADEIFTLTAQGLEFFAQTFGMPFPQRKYDQVFAPEYGGAMENYGCVTWSDVFLHRHPPAQSDWNRFSRVLLHELAHMWFGNLVTMRWWDDLWLNESFAEMASNWAAVRATKYTDAWAVHLAGDKLKAYVVDQGPTTHPIRQPIRDVAQAESTFDQITYPKGASVLYQLMAYVGEDRFAAALKAYFAEHAWGNTTLQDLIDAIEQASGRDLTRWRTGWLEQAGPDRLTLERDGDALVLVADGPRPQLLAVGAYRNSHDRLERTALGTVEVSGDRTPLDLPEADFYLVNDGDLTYATTRPDPATRDTFFDTAARLPTALSRGVVATTAWDMLITGDATTAEAVRCLTGLLGVETSESVIEPYLTLAADAADLYSPPSERDGLLAAVAQTCRTLAGTAGIRQAALRGFARTAGDLDEISWLQSVAADDIDLHWRTLVRKAQLGGSTAAEAQALLERDSDPDVWISHLQVRAATPDPAEKQAVWTKLTECLVPVGSVYRVATAFWSAGQDDLLKPYTEAYLDLIPNLHAGGMKYAMANSRSLQPLFGIDHDYLDRLGALVADADPTVRIGAVERAGRLRRMLNARGN